MVTVDRLLVALSRLDWLSRCSGLPGLPGGDALSMGGLARVSIEIRGVPGNRRWTGVRSGLSGLRHLAVGRLGCCRLAGQALAGVWLVGALLVLRGNCRVRMGGRRRGGLLRIPAGAGSSLAGAGGLGRVVGITHHLASGRWLAFLTSGAACSQSRGHRSASWRR